MKKIFVFILTAAMLLCAFSLQTAAADKITVYVTIANGSLVMTHEAITVTDIDGDDLITLYDALYCAHEAKFEGGAAAGFDTATGDYGLYLLKLWGVENGGSYGYYVNNAAFANLAGEIKDGDSLAAFVYQDAVGYSDVFCYFDTSTASVAEGGSVTLTLLSIGFDADWNIAVVPTESAAVSVNGSDLSTTDAEGKVTLVFDTTGTYVISASSSTQTLVPPVCIVTVSATTPETGDTMIVFVTAMMLCLIAAAAVLLARRNSYEK